MERVVDIITEDRKIVWSVKIIPEDAKIKEGDVVLFDSGDGIKRPAHIISHVKRASLDEVKRQRSCRPLNEEEKKRLRQKPRIEREARRLCAIKVEEKGLPMNLVDVEALIDEDKLMIYFTSETRVDFRELVRELAHHFRCRIEMRQIGVRNKAKIVGGIGTCGREVCCKAFLKQFEPVSIKMAKEQNLPLNPTKISGVCGRLMCCLTFENEYYEIKKRDLPKLGEKINTIYGQAKVIRHNIFRETITVSLDSGREKEIPWNEIIEEGNERSGG